MIDFDLPKELIAQEPAHPRDSARLLVYDRLKKEIIDTKFSELDKYLVENTTLVVNDSKVENCRYLFEDDKVEIFVLEKLDTNTVRAKVRPGRKFRPGKTYKFDDWFEAETLSMDDEGVRTLKLNISHDDSRLKKYEHIPLPPYIMQNDDLADEYQTIYAHPLGSKAAPTAGLHFTDNLMRQLSKNHDILEVTLHVGLGTFAPLTPENIKSGHLHSESYEISAETLGRLQKAKHVTAVGTTTTRTLESCLINSTAVKLIRQKGGGVSGETDIFIQPGYKFQKVDSMVTNFHLPGTSLLLMVEAFVGSSSELKRIYDHAIAEKYRFYSFGDAMLIL